MRTESYRNGWLAIGPMSMGNQIKQIPTPIYVNLSPRFSTFTTLPLTVPHMLVTVCIEEPYIRDVDQWN